jgi:hypothetical protein
MGASSNRRCHEYSDLLLAAAWGWLLGEFAMLDYSTVIQTAYRIKKSTLWDRKPEKYSSGIHPQRQAQFADKPKNLSANSSEDNPASLASVGYQIFVNIDSCTTVPLICG